ncbi:hypothetical protein EfmAA94_25620 [Enterococcus faecium]|nr:hypothetical protein EfmAA94_25620 [Enterococcus faecium]
MKAPINKNGIRKSDCKEIITKFWICVIVNGVSLARKPKTNEEIKKEKDGYLSKEEVQMIATLTP